MTPAHDHQGTDRLLPQMLHLTLRDGGHSILPILGLCLLCAACASVDTILLTSEKFPPKSSAEDVAVLEQKPARPHLELAELRIGDNWLSFATLQHRILARAAALGADAVVFSRAQTETVHQVAYEAAYDPWGYNSPYYGGPWGYGGYGGPLGGWGPWWGGYSGGVAVPYDETINMLMGVAIRYTNATGFGGRTGSETNSLWKATEKGSRGGAATSSQ